MAGDVIYETKRYFIVRKVTAPGIMAPPYMMLDETLRDVLGYR